MSRHVLVIDDERLIREMLSRTLEEHGLSVQTAPDGVAGLASLRADRPDVVLLDLMMPHMDGFDVLEALRDEPTVDAVQVIVLTARASQEILQEALKAGADDYISKPFHLGEVVARVQAHMRIAGYARRLKQKRRDGDRLLEISQRLTARLDLPGILQDVTSIVADVLATDRASIVLVGPERGVGRVVAASDDAGLTDREISLSAYPEIRRVLETRASLVVADMTADPLFDPVKDTVSQLKVRSSALFPMLEGERCIGVLFLRSNRPWETFTERQKQFGRIVANAVAVAVRNAGHFTALEQESHRISRARDVVERRLRIVQRYEDFFEGSADAVFITDGRGRVLFINRKAGALAGQEAPLSFRELVVEGCVARVDELFAAVRGGDLLGAVDLEMKGGRVASVSAARIPGEETYSLTARDVTEQRARDRELAETKDFLQSLIDASPDAIVAADLRGGVKVFNKAAERLYDRPAEQVVGALDAEDLFTAGELDRLERALRGEELGGRNRISPATRAQARDSGGRGVPVLLAASTVRVGGRTVATVWILRDLRDRIAMEAQLTETRERLQESERMAVLAELAGTTAHELNQPLTSVMGYAELLLRRLGPEDPNRRAAVVVGEQAQRMADIVRRLGHITRYETKPYVGSTRIIDLEAASGGDDPEDP